MTETICQQLKPFELQIKAEASIWF